MPLREQERVVCCAGEGLGAGAHRAFLATLVMALQDRRWLLPLYDGSTSSHLLWLQLKTAIQNAMTTASAVMPGWHLELKSDKWIVFTGLGDMSPSLRHELPGFLIGRNAGKGVPVHAQLYSASVCEIGGSGTSTQEGKDWSSLYRWRNLQRGVECLDHIRWQVHRAVMIELESEINSRNSLPGCRLSLAFSAAQSVRMARRLEACWHRQGTGGISTACVCSFGFFMEIRLA